MAIVVLVVLLLVGGLILGGLNRDFLNRQSQPGEAWSSAPTGNMFPVDQEFEKPPDESELL